MSGRRTRFRTQHEFAAVAGEILGGCLFVVVLGAVALVVIWLARSVLGV